jgi:hypothetical protein
VDATRLERPEEVHRPQVEPPHADLGHFAGTLEQLGRVLELPLGLLELCLEEKLTLRAYRRGLGDNPGPMLRGDDGGLLHRHIAQYASSSRPTSRAGKPRVSRGEACTRTS